MKITRRTLLRDVAVAVGETLRRGGIHAVLTGGACATIYSEGRYLSTDLDFILLSRTRQAQLDAAMTEVGFHREGDRYVHPQSPFWVEFPAGPLAIGGEHAVRPVEWRGRSGRTLALSPTDSCRDRLAAFYHWDDRQSLAVAAEVARRQDVDVDAIRVWSQREGHRDRFEEFLKEASRPTRSRPPARMRRRRASRSKERD